VPNKVRVIWRSSRGNRSGKVALDYVQNLCGHYWAKPEVTRAPTRWKKAQTAIRLIKAAGAAPGGTLLIYRDPRSIRTSRSAYKKMLQEMGISRPIPTIVQRRAQEETLSGNQIRDLSESLRQANWRDIQVPGATPEAAPAPRRLSFAYRNVDGSLATAPAPTVGAFLTAYDNVVRNVTIPAPEPAPIRWSDLASEAEEF
jgi:hypothetical protein